MKMKIDKIIIIKEDQVVNAETISMPTHSYSPDEGHKSTIVIDHREYEITCCEYNEDSRELSITIK